METLKNLGNKFIKVTVGLEKEVIPFGRVVTDGIVKHGKEFRNIID